LKAAFIFGAAVALAINFLGFALLSRMYPDQHHVERAFNMSGASLIAVVFLSVWGGAMFRAL